MNISSFRFILVPHVWNLSKMNPLLIECFTENINEIVLSGYPTENDYHGMKFILNILTHGHIKNLVLKFPSYCLMNILLPLLIYPRLYSLSYLSSIDENDFQQSNLFIQNFLLPIRKRKLCLQVQIHTTENQLNLNRVLSTNQRETNNIDDDDNDQSSNDTTHAIMSDSNHSLDFISNTTNINLPLHSSTLEISHDLSHIPSENLIQTNLRTIESSHMISLPEDNRFIIRKKKRFFLFLNKEFIDCRSTIEPYERLLPYLNRSQTIRQHSILTPIRQLSTSEQSVPIIPQTTNLLTEPISSSDSNLIRRYRPTTTISSTPINNHLLKKLENDINEEKYLILHLTPDHQTNSLTNLSISYVSSFETIEMIAIALLGIKI